MQGAKPQKIKAKRCGALMGGRSVFPWKFGGYQQILLQLVEVKGVPMNCQNCY